MIQEQNCAQDKAIQILFIFRLYNEINVYQG